MDDSTDLLLCTFVVDGYSFGVDALDVQEVMLQQPMTHAPLASPEVVGLVNLRGQVVTAIDLRTRLGLPARPSDHDGMSVVVRTAAGPVSFVVDDIAEVIEVPGGRLAPAPDTMGAQFRHLIVGIHQVDDGLVIVLDVARVARPMAGVT